MPEWTKYFKRQETNMKLIEWLEANRGEFISSYPARVDGEVKTVNMYSPRKRLVCADGFSVSVQEGHCLHSEVDANGNVTHVELGFPSAFMPEIAEHKDGGADDPDTDCVYAYVPVEKVEELIAAHGGIKE
jgi:hypothetical protein